MLSPRLPHALLALIAVAAIAFVGCGDSSDEASSALDEAVGYLPEDSGFAFVASTEVDDYDDFRDLLDRFPFAGQIEDSLKESFEQGDVDFDEQIKPLLGNDVVVGVDDNASFVNSSAETPFVLALETQDAGKLEDFAKDGGSSQGSSEGYDIYQGQEDDTWIAIKDEILVLSDNEETLKNALKQRGEDDRLTEDDVEAAFEDLPAEAPIKAYVNVKALLAADPDAAEALKVKWVDHIETLGLSAEATDDSVSIDWALRTDPEGLSDSDLPFAAGSEAPQVLARDDGSAEVVLGLRDPSQVVDFTLATLKAIDPAGYAEFEAGKQSIGKQLNIDVDDDVLAQLTGDVSAAVAIDGKFGMRAELADPDAFESTLANIMDRLPEFSDDYTVTKPKAGDRFYGLATEDGGSYAVGVANGALVIANNPELASEVATRELVDAEGLDGAFVGAADAEQLTNAVLGQVSGGLEGLAGSLFTGPLGDLLTSSTASTEGITGRLELKID
jgi:Protein of unknown function (DUF3352)